MFRVTRTTADVLLLWNLSSLEMCSESLRLRDQMERKVLVRNQQSRSVVFVSVIDLGLVWFEILYAPLSPVSISHCNRKPAMRAQ